ncbi:ArsB/NhaD family transporter [Bacillus sp. FJAT-22090]|uniref:ArsB/NhaD family transporter n=1 Tax=Bacillus sp. FJAT-22090 TaxID=1581038 RepID=UPI0011A28580|nr:ArsB/NhaD family transporter [Bacillus sp. FJAT-22090]
MKLLVNKTRLNRLATHDYFRKSIRGTYDLSKLIESKETIKDLKIFHLSRYVLVLLHIGYFTSEFIHTPFFIVAGVIEIFFILMVLRSEAVDTKTVMKGAPWNFLLGLYISLLLS